MKWLPWVLLVLVCILFAYNVLDTGISHTYREDAYETTQRQNAVMQKLLLAQFANTGKDELKKKLRAAHIDYFEKQDNDHDLIVADEVIFDFANGKLKTITVE